MIALQAIVLGIVEGLTEFLPVSSTFHLIWAANILGLAQTEQQKVFAVVIQSGAILAVIFLYFRTLVNDSHLIKKIIISFLPTAIVGLVLYKLIKDVFFENYILQLTMFALVGIIFIVFEKTRQGHAYTRNSADLTYAEAIMIGLAQSLAVIPGVSRAGAVILALMLYNVKRDEAAKYSFLLAIPTIGSASLFDLYKSRHEILIQDNWLMLGIGFLVSFIVALIVIRWLTYYLQHHTMTMFGWYRLIATAGLLLFLAFH